jgi:hypothetical protein
MSRPAHESDDSRWKVWYDKLAYRTTKRSPAFVSIVLPESRANDFSVWACEQVFAERGYALENRENVKGSLSVGPATVPMSLMRVCSSRTDANDAPATADTSTNPQSLARFSRKCERVARRKTKRRPLDVGFRLRIRRGRRSRRTVERQIQLAEEAFEQRGYRLAGRTLSGKTWKLIYRAVSERPVIRLTFHRQS